jgi:hypothetical protein
MSIMDGRLPPPCFPETRAEGLERETPRAKALEMTPGPSDLSTPDGTQPLFEVSHFDVSKDIASDGLRSKVQAAQANILATLEAWGTPGRARLALFEQLEENPPSALDVERILRAGQDLPEEDHARLVAMMALGSVKTLRDLRTVAEVPGRLASEDRQRTSLVENLHGIITGRFSRADLPIALAGYDPSLLYESTLSDLAEPRRISQHLWSGACGVTSPQEAFARDLPADYARYMRETGLDSQLPMWFGYANVRQEPGDFPVTLDEHPDDGSYAVTWARTFKEQKNSVDGLGDLRSPTEILFQNLMKRWCELRQPNFSKGATASQVAAMLSVLYARPFKALEFTQRGAPGTVLNRYEVEAGDPRLLEALGAHIGQIPGPVFLTTTRHCMELCAWQTDPDRLFAFNPWPLYAHSKLEGWVEEPQMGIYSTERARAPDVIVRLIIPADFHLDPPAETG